MLGTVGEVINGPALDGRCETPRSGAGRPGVLGRDLGNYRPDDPGHFLHLGRTWRRGACDPGGGAGMTRLVLKSGLGGEAGTVHPGAAGVEEESAGACLTRIVISRSLDAGHIRGGRRAIGGWVFPRSRRNSDQRACLDRYVAHGSPGHPNRDSRETPETPDPAVPDVCTLRRRLRRPNPSNRKEIGSVGMRSCVGWECSGRGQDAPSRGRTGSAGIGLRPDRPSKVG